MPRKPRPSEMARFKSWISANGGEVLEETNPYEMVRFRSLGGVSIIYQNAAGRKSFVGDAAVAFDTFKANKTMRLCPKTKRRGKGVVVIETLASRDGDACWYCGEPFADMSPTIEHLVSVTHGGPDHIANKVLACSPCNVEAGHLSVAEKVRLRDRKHGFARRQPAPIPHFLCEAA